MGKCTTEKFVEKAKKKYGDKYDYSKVEYNGYNVKVCIICQEHGEFWQTPDRFLQGRGCPRCGLELMKKSLTKTSDEWIEEARKIHGDKYDYSKVEYKNAHTKVCIICPKHGEFWQTATKHITCKKSGCPICAREKQTLTTEEFIRRAKQIHGNKYDYTKTKYVNQKTKVCIICPKHGEFWQLPNGHLEGKGCYECGRERTVSSLFSNTEDFIKKAKEVHGDKYDYSKVVYEHNQKKVCIICPEHGEFWQTPNNHIGASNKCGCPKCKMSKLESFVSKLLENNGVDYIHECSKKDLKWLGKQKLDFYLPSKKLVIECQGLQHFKPSNFGGKIDKKICLNKNIEYDIKKFNKCTENGLNVTYIVDDKNSIIDIPIYKYNNVYTKEEFIKFIENENKD